MRQATTGTHMSIQYVTVVLYDSAKGEGKKHSFERMKGRHWLKFSYSPFSLR